MGYVRLTQFVQQSRKTRLGPRVLAMKLSAFTSEYEPGDLPIITGAPMEKGPLNENVAGFSAGDWAQESIANLCGSAVFSYYFAKRVRVGLEAITPQLGPLRIAYEGIRVSLVKAAVIDIATTIDMTGRTKSLPHLLDAVTRDLQEEPQDEETVAAIQLVHDIRALTNADTVVSLRYARHLRNKWAGHASLDRGYDSWADADTTVSFPLLEDALVRMVNAYTELGTLSEMSSALRAIADAARHETVLPDGTVQIQMTLGWSGIANIATVTRHIAQDAAETFLAQLREGRAEAVSGT
jgi:hypothetical protein